MNDRFGPHAARLFACAAQLLGWRPDEFWNATPAEFAAALTPLDRAQAMPLDRANLEKLMECDNG
jgi:uncharacterized phage protein (TIGR02216 family)